MTMNLTFIGDGSEDKYPPSGGIENANGPPGFRRAVNFATGDRIQPAQPIGRMVRPNFSFSTSAMAR
jgi:hypothetical protein